MVFDCQEIKGLLTYLLTYLRINLLTYLFIYLLKNSTSIIGSLKRFSRRTITEEQLRGIRHGGNKEGLCENKTSSNNLIHYKWNFRDGIRLVLTCHKQKKRRH